MRAGKPNQPPGAGEHPQRASRTWPGQVQPHPQGRPEATLPPRREGGGFPMRVCLPWWHWWHCCPSPACQVRSRGERGWSRSSPGQPPHTTHAAQGACQPPRTCQGMPPQPRPRCPAGLRGYHAVHVKDKCPAARSPLPAGAGGPLGTHPALVSQGWAPVAAWWPGMARSLEQGGSLLSRHRDRVLSPAWVQEEEQTHLSLAKPRVSEGMRVTPRSQPAPRSHKKKKRKPAVARRPLWASRASGTQCGAETLHET